MRLPNNEVFAMEPGALEAFVSKVGAMANLARLETASAGAGDMYDTSPDGEATVYISGVLLKSTSDAQMYRAYGEEATAYGEIMTALAMAEADPGVKRVCLAVDSPGGQVAGIHAVSDRLAGYSKPVFAHVGTMAASAAYWLASQADEITAPRGAEIGSIGAYVVVADMSQMAENAGVKVHVISSGAHKGAGVPGTVVTEAQLADIQKRIDDIAAEFVADVARGRGETPTRIHESADGRVYSTTDSITRGLIDRISADPSKERKMADAAALAHKDLAALLAEHPDQARLVSDKMLAGVGVADIRAAIEKAKADSAVADKIAAAEKLAADANAALAVLKAEKLASDAEVVALKASLAKVEAAHLALKALGEGAKAADKVQADPPAQAKAEKTDAEIEAMSPMEKARYFASLARASSKSN